MNTGHVIICPGLFFASVFKTTADRLDKFNAADDDPEVAVGGRLDRLAMAASPVFDEKACIRDSRLFRSECLFHFFTVIWQSEQAIEGTFLQFADAPNRRIWPMIWEA